MHYYEVWVRSEQYRGHEALTYSHIETLSIGQIVVVPMRDEFVPAVVIKQVRRPGFKVKPIQSVPALPQLPHVTVQLAKWLQTFYATPVGVAMMHFLPRAIHERYLNSMSLTDIPLIQPLKVTFTPEQASALQTIDKPNTYLLHGRTGSGKTNIYIALTERMIKSGKSVLILSPEIGLTSQLANSFRHVFGSRVVVLHSQLTAKERETTWLTILTAQVPMIVIGTRSALFSPLQGVGLIVIDEVHDQAYKQEQAPYYHAVRAASSLRELSNAVLVLGSATPTVTDYYFAEVKNKPIIRIATLAQPTDGLSNSLTVIDLKDRGNFQRSPHLSQPLIDAIGLSLHKGEQSLLYLNRRGTARAILCSRCGWQALCPHCDLPLTYHGDAFKLRCHTCGYEGKQLFQCPDCNNQDIIFKSFGTKAVVGEVERLFPSARIVRLDSDNNKAERLEQQYEAIARGDVDILVGTQMVAKGLDLPRLSTLGVILADSSLYLPDYTAEERTYQLLTQVLGRIGRGHVAGTAIVQTYYPNSSLLRAAMADDWSSFYAHEITQRKLYLFPPFRFLLKVAVRRASAAAAERTANLLAAKLQETNLQITVDGPMPSFHEKVQGKYQWQLVIKAEHRQELLRVVQLLPAGWSFDLDPADLL